MSKKTKTTQVQNQPQQASIPVLQRGCGWPILGGTYLYVPSGFSGTPIWRMLIDPTVPVTEDFISMSAIGMVLKERTGSRGQTVYDLWDWIGGKAYPNPTDWFLEVQQLGFHQKVNPAHMSYLSEESYYFAVHGRASYVDPTSAYATREVKPDLADKYPQYGYCPCGIPEHKVIPGDITTAGDYMHLGTCPGLFFSDIIKGSKPENGTRVTVREMPSFSYDGWVADPDIVERGMLEYQPAAFFRLPIGRWATVLKYADKDCLADVEKDAQELLEQLDEKFKKIRIVNVDGG